MKYTTTIRKTGSLLIAMLLLLMACDKQGPMGPEGPPGPDGANAGGAGGSSVTTYFVENELEPFWENVDGWGDYEVYNLAIGSYRWPNLMPLPDTAISKVDNGGMILVYLKIDGAWRRLPFKDGFHNGKGNYDYYFNYEVDGGKIAINAKVLDDIEVNVDEFTVERVKIVVAPASATVPLNL
jgi:hypothetical protein